MGKVLEIGISKNKGDKIVNVNEVIKVEPLGKGDYSIYLAGEIKLKLSRKYKDEFFKLFK